MTYFQQTKLGESRWWSWIVVTAIAFVSWVVFQLLLLLPFPAIAEAVDPELYEKYNSLFDGTAGADTTAGDVITELMRASPLIYALFLLTFPAGLIGIYLGQKLVHSRTIKSLHTAASQFRIPRVLQGFFLTWAVLGSFAFIANAIGLIDVEFVFNGGKFWIYALVSLLFIPLQSATEEIVFRGYFNQGLTHLIKSKWIAFAITSFAFMALHSSNPEALEGAASGTLPIVMSGYFFFGFAMCLIVWIDDGLETAIGIHAGNNCFAAVIMNYENSVLPTPSVFLTGSDPIKDAISTIFVLAVLVAIIWFWRGNPNQRPPVQEEDGLRFWTD